MMQGRNSLNLRRTKSTTGINHCAWSNENNNNTNKRTHSDETLAKFGGRIMKSCIDPLAVAIAAAAVDAAAAANNGKASSTTKTIHNISTWQPTTSDIRWDLMKHSKESAQKSHSQRMADKASKGKHKHSIDGINDKKSSSNNHLQANNSMNITKICASNSHRRNSLTANNNNNNNNDDDDTDIFSLNLKANKHAAKTMESTMADCAVPLAGKNSISIIEMRSHCEPNAKQIATNSSTNPFLKQETAHSVADRRSSRNPNTKEANESAKGNEMNRCEPFDVKEMRNDIHARSAKHTTTNTNKTGNDYNSGEGKTHASNDVEETISNQFIANDDTISTKLNRLSAHSDNEPNSNEYSKRDLHRNESYSGGRTKRQQQKKYDRMMRNLLEFENDNDDNIGNQWDDAVANRSATLMKYGNKKRRHKDDGVNRDVHKHNRSTDNLSSIEQHSATMRGHKNQKYYSMAESGSGSSNKNQNYLNELDQQLMNDDKQKRQPISYVAYAKNRKYITNAISDIPTCPFQRQDYTIPGNDSTTDTFAGRSSKKSKKDLLLNFALQKGKYLSNTITRSGNSGSSNNDNANDCNGLRTAGNYINTVNTSGVEGNGGNSNSISGTTRTFATTTATTTITHVSGKASYLKKLNVGYANRLVSASQAKHHSLHFRHKDDKTYFDKTKKSLLKIGQKCGFKLNNSLASGGGGGGDGVDIPVKRYAASSLREPFTDFDRGAHHYSSSSHFKQSSPLTTTEKVPYKSYRSEMDLTKNLHYLDAFLNENFDRLSQPKQGSHSIGKCSMPSASSVRHRKNFQEFQHRTQQHHHHNHHRHQRTQSVSEMSEFDPIETESYTMYGNAAIAELTNATIKMQNSLENNYAATTMDGKAVPPAAMLRRDFVANNANNCVPAEYRTSSISDNLSLMGQHHQSNPYAISSSTSESFSFKQQSMSNQSPNQSNQPQSSSSQSNSKLTLAKDSHALAHANVFASSSCERSAKSQTTSSSLSSSDYASVYSPNSEKHYQPQQQQQQQPMPKLSNELSAFKQQQKRYAPISNSTQYQKRNSFTAHDLMMYDDASTTVNHLSDMPRKQLKCSDGFGGERTTTDIDSDSDDNSDDGDDDDTADNIANDGDNDDDNNDDDDSDGVDQNVAGNFNNFNECSNYARNISQSDKLQLLEKSLYQYENKLSSYHEDYLQHYYNKSGASAGVSVGGISAGAHRKSTSSISVMQIQTHVQPSPVTPLAYPHLQESRLNYAQSTLNLPSGSTTTAVASAAAAAPYYTHEVTVRKHPNYPQNRVVITKQKNNHSNTNDIVLEYEC